MCWSGCAWRVCTHVSLSFPVALQLGWPAWRALGASKHARAASAHSIATTRVTLSRSRKLLCRPPCDTARRPQSSLRVAEEPQIPAGHPGRRPNESAARKLERRAGGQHRRQGGVFRRPGVLHRCERCGPGTGLCGVGYCAFDGPAVTAAATSIPDGRPSSPPGPSRARLRHHQGPLRPLLQLPTHRSRGSARLRPAHKVLRAGSDISNSSVEGCGGGWQVLFGAWVLGACLPWQPAGGGGRHGQGTPECACATPANAHANTPGSFNLVTINVGSNTALDKYFAVRRALRGNMLFLFFLLMKELFIVWGWGEPAVQQSKHACGAPWPRMRRGKLSLGLPPTCAAPAPVRARQYVQDARDRWQQVITVDVRGCQRGGDRKRGPAWVGDVDCCHGPCAPNGCLLARVATRRARPTNAAARLAKPTRTKRPRTHTAARCRPRRVWRARV